MQSAHVDVDLSPDPILAAVDGYRGSVSELERGLAISGGELAAARQQLSRKLSQSGLRTGDRVVLAVGNGGLFPVALAAILAGGGCPLLTHVKTPLAELTRTAQHFDGAFVLTDAWSQSELGTIANDAATLDIAPHFCPTFGRLNGVTGREFSLHGVPLHPTSGTTGLPKVAIRPGPCAVAEADHYIETIGIDSNDSILAIPPMSHAYAYGMCFMVPMLSGADIVTMREFNPKTVFDAVAQHRLTILPAVPAMLDVLLLGGGDRLKTFPRTITSAGAPLSERTAQRFLEKSGILVRPLYGTTETGGIAVGVGDREASIPGCVGPAMKGVEAALDRATSGLDAGHELGTMCIRSSSMMAGYLNGDSIDTSALDDGWFKTGDLAFIDDHAAIHLKGRQTEVINVGGLKVVPSEVEEVIRLMPQVLEVKVYAGTPKSGPQFVKAAIVKATDLDARDVRRHCEEHLVFYKRPGTILFVDSLPKTPSGKIILSQLP